MRAETNGAESQRQYFLIKPVIKGVSCPFDRACPELVERIMTGIKGPASFEKILSYIGLMYAVAAPCAGATGGVI